MRYSITNVTKDQLDQVGATDVKFAKASNIYFATLTQNQIARLANAKIKPIGKTTTQVSPPTPVAAQPTYYGSQLIEAIGIPEVREMLSPPIYGENTVIAMIDTGIRETHDQIAGHVVYSESFCGGGTTDDFNHGTGTSSLALIVAPEAKLLNLKVIGASGEGTEESIVLALEKCMEFNDTDSPYRPHVVNISLGSPDVGDEDNVVRVACRALNDRGVWIFAAAGNGGPSPSTVMVPACERYVGCVGSCSFDPFAISSWSSRGPTVDGLTKPDVVMFGEDIIMASSGGDSATVAASGTSFSCPLVAGLACLYYEGMVRFGKIEFVEESPDADYPRIIYLTSIPHEVEALLPSICIKPSGLPPGQDDSYGWGLIWGALAAQAIRTEVIGIDITSLISPMITIMMMGMMMKMMTGIGK